MIALIVISILLVGTTSFISALGYSSYVRNAIGIVLTPIQKGADSLFDGLEDLFTSKKDVQALKDENAKLKNELSEQKDKLSKAELALKENEELKKYLGIKSENTDLVFTSATVTGRQSGSHASVYTLNKGSFHGIEPGMPVIDQNGVIGYITEVGLNWSKASPVTDPDVSVGILIEKTGETGVSSGSFSASKDGFCTVTYLPQDTEVANGDRIVTSGEGSYFPKGLLIGYVDHTETDPISRETIAYVKPTANLTEACSVMIITDFETKYE